MKIKSKTILTKKKNIKLCQNHFEGIGGIKISLFDKIINAVDRFVSMCGRKKKK